MLKNSYENEEIIVCMVDGVTYGMNILEVQEISAGRSYTKLHLTHNFILGALNLRGDVVTLMDLRSRFGRTRLETPEKQPILIVKDKTELIGLLVDEVLGVFPVASEDLENAPVIIDDTVAPFLTGVHRCGPHIACILNVSRVCSPS